MKLELYYIAFPYRQTQKWGVYKPEVYSRFGFTSHNGEDVALGSDKLVCAPVKLKITQVGYQPKGAGNFVSGITVDEYDEWAKSAPRAYKIYFTFMHLEKALCKEGDILDIGDLIGKGGNTGFSTGEHTHIFAGRVDGNKFVDTELKDTNYSFDHTKYYVGEYAINHKLQRIEKEKEEQKKLENLKYQLDNVEAQLGVIAKLIQALKQLFKVG